MGACNSTSKDSLQDNGLRVKNGSVAILENKKASMIYKIVLIGNKSVGKSSLVLRYIQNEFNPTHNLTIGAAFISKEISIRIKDKAEDNIKSMTLHIWDTAGEETYKSMTRFFFRDAHSALVVFDLTSIASFESVSSWISDFESQCPTASIVLIGNKSDMDSRRNVAKSLIDNYVENYNKKILNEKMTYYECSCRLGTGVNEVFEETSKVLLKNSLKLDIEKLEILSPFSL